MERSFERPPHRLKPRTFGKEAQGFHGGTVYHLVEVGRSIVRSQRTEAEQGRPFHSRPRCSQPLVIIRHPRHWTGHRRTGTFATRGAVHTRHNARARDRDGPALGARRACALCVSQPRVISTPKTPDRRFTAEATRTTDARRHKREGFSDDRRDELLWKAAQDPHTYPLCMRLLCVWLLAHVQTIAAAAPVLTVASNFAPAVVSPAKWHLSRRTQILSNHPEVKELIGKEEWTVPILAATNIAQVGCATAFAHLPAPVQVPLAILLGGTLSLWQFTLLHDVIHGTAALPKGVRRNDVLFAGSLPSLFGYYIYLRYGHLTHHKSFGGEPLAALFDSEQSDFEDGDALFVAHRQRLSGDQPDGRIGFFGKADVGGLGISISRTIYALLWLDAAAPPSAASMPVAADAAAAAASAITDAHPVGSRARAVCGPCGGRYSRGFERGRPRACRARRPVRSNDTRV